MQIEKYNVKIFDDIKHIDEFGNEYWLARELQKVLEYKEWRKFNNIIQKAKNACDGSNINTFDHFVQLDKMIDIAKGAKRKVIDYKLTRYACYLIAQNGDSHMKIIALAQTYFAIQTRKQEILEENLELEYRLKLRKEVKNGNFGLNRTAINSGVQDLAKFHNAGYKGLYNGETADDIFKRKKLRYREDILDNMGSVELASNLFRIAQTNDKLKRDKVDNEYTANSIHYEMGKNIREFIKSMGGTMPEKLPTPNKSLKGLDKETKEIV